MSFSERNLRDALEPLRGDRARALENVLAALPIEPEATRPARPRTPWLTAAAAAGLLLGVGVGRLVGPGANPEPDSPPPTAEVQHVALVRHRYGDVALEDERGGSKIDVGHRVPPDHFVATGSDGAVFFSMTDGADVRVDSKSRFYFGSGHTADLQHGRIHVTTSGRFLIDCVDGSVVTRAGAAVVSSWGGASRIVAVAGEVLFTDSTGEEIAVPERQMVVVEDGVVSGPKPAGGIWPHVEWQANLWFRCGGVDEALEYLYPLVSELIDPDARVANRAESTLRRAGGLGGMAVGMVAWDLSDREAGLRRRCYALLTDLADVDAVPFLEQGLMVNDPDVRVAAFDGIVRLTGIDLGFDRAFWRDSPRAVRFDALKGLRMKLGAFRK